MGARSPGGFQLLDLNAGHRDGSPNNGHQGDMPCRRN